MKASEMSDDKLCEELMAWARISRNENGLKETDRKHFRADSSEIGKRGLLDRKKLACANDPEIRKKHE